MEIFKLLRQKGNQITIVIIIDFSRFGSRKYLERYLENIESYFKGTSSPYDLPGGILPP